MNRVAAGLLLWTIAAVPAALLLGHLFAATRQDLADEAAAYLRQVAPLPRRRRPPTKVVALGMAVMVGLGTHAAADERVAGSDDAADAATTSAGASDRRTGPAGAVVGRAAGADLPPVGDRTREAPVRPTPGQDPDREDGRPEAAPAPVSGGVIPDALGRICAVLDDTLGIKPPGACEATATPAPLDQGAGDGADTPTPRHVLPSPLP